MILNTIKEIWYYLVNYTPSPAFLSDLISFQAVVLSLALPISIIIVTRITERYKSDSIAQRFLDEWEFKLLFWLLICSIILNVCIKFFFTGTICFLFWKNVAYFALALFFITMFVFIKFVSLLKKYIIGREYILDELFQEIQEYIEE